MDQSHLGINQLPNGEEILESGNFLSGCWTFASVMRPFNNSLSSHTLLDSALKDLISAYLTPPWCKLQIHLWQQSWTIKWCDKDWYHKTIQIFLKWLGMQWLEICYSNKIWTAKSDVETSTEKNKSTKIQLMIRRWTVVTGHMSMKTNNVETESQARIIQHTWWCQPLLQNLCWEIISISKIVESNYPEWKTNLGVVEKL